MECPKELKGHSKAYIEEYMELLRNFSVPFIKEKSWYTLVTLVYLHQGNTPTAREILKEMDYIRKFL